MKNALNNSKYNIIAIIIFEIITCSISFSANFSDHSIMSTIIKWTPAIIGISTLFVYFVSRLFIKKLNWIITILGIILMLYAALTIYGTDFSQTL
ncbi:hypothetical protein ES677_05665 [Bizionia gelidisalsuginis]|uniref:Uncharacterized protein n=2 Tax=Bizionia TaxID=283785 RepID=A0A8H2LBY1_9FLAO|nr:MULTISPECIES: hypothetical protein [Bizionia]TYB73097.1 hypothetical protein ES676_10095 [Bizionia saleffrena]TYC14867.1 hypothetical protein ES677_05665 [Bizionia gelidisalsuginis]